MLGGARKKGGGRALKKKSFLMLLILSLASSAAVNPGFEFAQAAGVPGQPAKPNASVGNLQATVSWTAPFDNGSPITSYSALASPGGASCSVPAPALTCAVQGLTNGVSYTFTVRATNSVGTSLPSPASSAVVPALTSLVGPELTLGTTNVSQALTLSDGSASFYVVDSSATAGSTLIMHTIDDPGNLSSLQLASGEKIRAMAFGLNEDFLYLSTSTNTQVRIHELDIVGFSITKSSGRLSGGYFYKQLVAVPGGQFLFAISNQFRTLIRLSDLTLVDNVELWDSNTGLAFDSAAQLAYWTNWVNLSSRYGHLYRYDLVAKRVTRSAQLSSVGVGIVPEMFLTPYGSLIAVHARESRFNSQNLLGRYNPAFASNTQPRTGTYFFPGEVMGVKSFDSGKYVAVVVFDQNQTDLLKFDTNSLELLQRVTLGSRRIPVAMTTIADMRLRIVYSNEGIFRDLFVTDVASAPLNTIGVFQNSAVDVSWSAPSYEGLGEIEGYKVKAYPGGATCESEDLSCTVSGLTNGTSYVFRVSAITSEGESPLSEATQAVIPATVPGSPTQVSAALDGDKAVNVSWSAPQVTGGADVSGYVVYLGGVSKCESITTTCRVTGLTAGEEVSFTVKARNKAGLGENSEPSNEVVPITVPGAPTSVAAEYGNTLARVSWSAPVFTGYSPITSYTVVSEPGDRTCQASNPSVRECTVSGLTNGTQYTFKVRANNNAGAGALSSASTPIIPRTTPQPPTNLTAVPQDRIVTVGWQAPTNNGGASITSYTATSSPGGLTCTTTFGTVCIVSGLTNGTSYTFTVTARNSEGSSSASTASSQVIPNIVPDAPTDVAAVYGNTQATVSWSAPTANAGTAILNYTVEAYAAGNSFPLRIYAASASATSHLATGLTNGIKYTFKVRASNAMGQGALSVASNEITPRTIPSAPATPSVTRGDAKVTVNWSAPNNGGAAIISYIVESSAGLHSCTTNATSCEIAGLTNGTSYNFRVRATNSEGDSLWSPLSASVIPNVVPNPPTNITVLYGNAQATVSWSAPSPNGGTAITSYTVSVVSPTGNLRTCTASGSETSCTVTNLSNGVSHTFRVRAANALGSSLFSSTSSPVIPRTIPSAPATPSVTRGDAKVTVNWSAPNNGGAAIISYIVESSAGLHSCTTNATSCEIAGLTNGTSYNFRVRATNSEGDSLWSPLSASVIPNVVPNPPTNVVARYATRSVFVSWTAPLSNGGTAITQYTVTSNPTSRTCVASDASGCLVSGLTNGTNYTFVVRAVNAAGTGSPSSASNVVAPRSTPGPVSAVEVEHRDSAVLVSWEPPVDIHESGISYVVTSNPTGRTCTTSTQASCLVAGLKNGISYQFAVVAQYGNGDRGSSVTSIPVSPSTIPGEPRGPVAQAGYLSGLVSWTAPASDGGNSVSRYQAIASPGGQTCTTSTTNCTVPGLDLGSRYKFLVRAENVNGWGPWSEITSEILVGTRPDSPNSVYAIPQSFGARVYWSEPLNTGGFSVEKYIVTSSPGGFICSTGGATTCLMNGLQNGVDYTFTVRAETELDVSVESIASSLVKPVQRDNQPSSLSSVFVSATDIRAVWSPVLTFELPVNSYLVELLSRVYPYDTIESITVPASQLTHVFSNIDPSDVYRIQVTAMDLNLDELGVLSLDAQNSRLPAQYEASEVAGDLRSGGVLVSRFGSWIGTPLPSISHQWYTCTSQHDQIQTLPSDCAPISRATQSTFVANSTHIGKFLLAGVTATNTAGSVTVFGETTNQIGGAPTIARSPKVTFPKAVSSETTLLADAGSWAGAPTPEISLNWERCTTATKLGSAMLNNCSAISGATSTSYTTTSLDSGRFIRLVIRATNTHGTLVFYSPSTTAVLAKVVSLVAPTIQGAATAGQKLSVSNGLWQGNPKFKYQWYSCTSQHDQIQTLPSDCAPISRATQSTFVANSTHIGKFLLAGVTATNTVSSGTRFTQTGQIR